MSDAIVITSAVVTGLLAASYALSRLDQRQQRRHAANLGGDEEAVERFCGMLDDPTPGDDAEVARLMGELEPAQPITGDTLVLVGPGFVHRRCRDARRDGGKPCVDCYRVFVGVS